MKVGDLVKWIGFPGASRPPEKTGPSAPGIVLEITIDMSGNKRIDVLWPDRTIGKNLYEQTLESVL
tara:strand:- start:67 stop:264 length:198 start_codon:yes stop_codon:yes gene_type:complete